MHNYLIEKSNSKTIEYYHIRNLEKKKKTLMWFYNALRGYIFLQFEIYFYAVENWCNLKLSAYYRAQGTHVKSIWLLASAFILFKYKFSRETERKRKSEQAREKPREIVCSNTPISVMRISFLHPSLFASDPLRNRRRDFVLPSFPWLKSFDVDIRSARWDCVQPCYRFEVNITSFLNLSIVKKYFDLENCSFHCEVLVLSPRFLVEI